MMSNSATAIKSDFDAVSTVYGFLDDDNYRRKIHDRIERYKSESLCFKDSQTTALYKTSDIAAPITIDNSNVFCNQDRPVFVAEQEWEGIVIDIEDDFFIARLTDKTSLDQDEEEASFKIDSITNGQCELLKLGAIFRWAIGYMHTTQSLTKRKESLIIFRRLPAWTAMEIKQSKFEAEELISYFLEHNNDSPDLI